MPFKPGQSGNPKGRSKNPQDKELRTESSPEQEPIAPIASKPVEFASDASMVPSPISGVVPPVEYRFKPGEKPPAGCGRAKNSGASIREWINTLTAQKLKEREIRAIARDEECEYAKREAAIRMLRSLEDGDIADYEPALLGKSTLQELREQGFKTTLVKRMKIKTKTYGKPGEETEEEERELELHDRGLKEAEWIVSHTDGKATQRVEVVGPPIITLNINIPGMRFIPESFRRPVAVLPEPK